MSLQIFQVNLKMQNKIFICLLYKSKDNHDVTTKQLNYMIVRIVDNTAMEMQKLVIFIQKSPQLIILVLKSR